MRNLWYNIYVGRRKMNEKFIFDIENIKSELEIEGMYLSKEDVDLLQMYSDKQISKDELINTIKQTTMEGIKNNARFI